MEQISTIRNNVIEQQVRPWGGLNSKVNRVLQEIPRELFVPDNYKDFAFTDMEIPLSDKAKMFSPKLEGRLLDALNIKEDENVLEIGTGSGYLTAVLSKLAKSVTSIDIDNSFIDNTAKKLNSLAIDNVKLLVDDASRGLKIDDFFDVVVVNIAVPKITGRYFHLLNIGGRIFVVEGTGNTMTAKLITRKTAEKWDTKSIFDTKIETMIGLEATREFKF